MLLAIQCDEPALNGILYVVKNLLNKNRSIDESEHRCFFQYHNEPIDGP